MDVRTDRVGLLLDQLDSSIDFARERLTGLTDDEMMWEPVRGCFSVRRRGDARSPRPVGAGDWVLDWGVDDGAPEPFTTIAWRLGHLGAGTAGRWEWTFGDRRADMDADYPYSASADAMLAELWAWLQRWREGVDGLTDEQLDTVGFGQYPHGLDPDLPIIAIVWWVNREVIHHLAEAATLRDLYANRASLGAG
ncbi:MAG TPA: DinB family protein [Mycobacteriales bacterium]|nr:DinB family protein [Mycobacteriales bacterium]